MSFCLRKFLHTFQQGCVDTRTLGVPAWECAECTDSAVELMGRQGIPRDTAEKLLRQPLGVTFPDSCFVVERDVFKRSSGDGAVGGFLRYAHEYQHLLVRLNEYLRTKGMPLRRVPSTREVIQCLGYDKAMQMGVPYDACADAWGVNFRRASDAWKKWEPVYPNSACYEHWRREGGK